MDYFLPTFEYDREQMWWTDEPADKEDRPDSQQKSSVVW